MRLTDIVGHQVQVDLFRRLLRRDRVPNGVVIEGPVGVGRRTLARALAMALLCPERVDGDACGSCSSCRQLAGDSHPDYAELPAAKQRADLKVDEIREQVVQPAQESAFMGNGRVFVIPDCERLRGASANALLKVLEEPAAGTRFLMTTSMAGGLLETIRSRTQTYRLQELSVEDLQTVLIRGGVSGPEALARARVGRGSHAGLWRGSLPPAPTADLRRLLTRGLDPVVVCDVLDQLQEATGEVPSGSTVAKEQRRVLLFWFDHLVEDLRSDLRGEDAVRVGDWIGKVLQARGDLERYIQPRLVVEGLGL